MRARLRAATIAVALALHAAEAAAQPQPPAPRAEPTPEVRIEREGAHGAHRVDVQGRALYRFLADRPGQGERPPESACDDQCLSRWPPLVSSRSDARGAGAVGDPRLGTFVRPSGVRQVTYDGWPLYSYAPDEGGRVTEHDVEDSGGRWVLARPEPAGSGGGR
jgi:predicted lipoprotein with Yx(FWY)xxD motif